VGRFASACRCLVMPVDILTNSVTPVVERLSDGAETDCVTACAFFSTSEDQLADALLACTAGRCCSIEVCMTENGWLS
jgi:hypothetical protein